MEYIDVLDENGNLTGKTKLKDEAHRDGIWHGASHVWIVNPEGQLLVQKRSVNKISHPNKWDISAAGHIEAGEKPIDAAIRETEEELGLKFTPDALEHLFDYKQQCVLNNGTFINNEYDSVYLVEIDVNLEKLKLQEEEISKIKLISQNELKEVLESDNQSFVKHNEEYEKLLEILHERFK